jgi:transposase
MRGDDRQQLGVFSYVSAEERIAADHPLRAIRQMVDEALTGLSVHLDTLYAAGGRPSIAPERLVRALLLQALYSVRSERQVMEQMDYNLLFRWFVGLNMDDAIWDVTVFTKNRERLMRGEVAERLLLAVVQQAHANRLLSQEHFTVDGTLIQAWANRRSFKEKPDPPSRGTGSGGKKLLRDTHESSTDPEARLYKKCGCGCAGLSGPCDYREPQRSGGPSSGYSGQHHCGARGRAGHARQTEAEWGTDHAGCRQGLSARSVRRKSAAAARAPACCRI